MMEQNDLGESKSSQSGPVPLPRPRQHVNQDANTHQPTSYVNVTVEPIPANNVPVPAPRQRTKIVIFDEEQKPQGGTGCEQDERYQNVVIVRPAPPSPAQLSQGSAARKVASHEPVGGFPGSDTSLGDNLRELKIRNDTRDSVTGTNQRGLEAVDKPSDEVRADEEPQSPSVDGKYKTLSPGDLFKTIGTASRMLTESIGERVAHKTKKVAHNVRNTGTSLVAWGHESRKSAAGKLLKSVGKSEKTDAATEPMGTEQKTSPTKSKSASNSPKTARPHSVASSPDVIGKIRFDSPLMNNAVAASGTSPTVQATYDIPRKRNLLTGLRSTDSTPTSTAPSSHGGSVGVSSSSLASSEGTEVARGLFERNAPASQSLYSRVVPKRNRGAAANDAVIPPPGQLARTSKNKSESNLYESVFYIGPPGPTGALTTANDGVYGKLNIIPRSKMSSSSSSLSASSHQDAGGSEEDNTAHDTIRSGVRVRNKAAPSGGDVKSPKGTERHRRIFSRRLSIGELDQQQQNLRSDSWNFYDITTTASGTSDTFDNRKQEGERLEDPEEEEEVISISHLSTPEPFYENSEPDRMPMPISVQLAQMRSLNVLQPVPIGVEGIHLRHDYDEVSIADIIDEFDPLAGAVSYGSALEAIIEQDSSNGEQGDNLALIENLLGAESYSRMPKRVSGRLVSERCPKPPQRSDSLLVTETSATAASTTEPAASPTVAPERAVPAKPVRRKVIRSIGRPAEQTVSQIIHQNLNLPSGSVDNLVELEEHLIEPHLARTADDEPANGDAPVDLSYPRGPQTNWYVGEMELHNAGNAAQELVPINTNIYRKRVTVDPINENRPGNANADPTGKVSKSPFMATGSGSTSGGRRPLQDEEGSSDDERTSYLPTYLEAIAGSDQPTERGPAETPAAATVAASPSAGTTTGAIAKSASVATKLLNVLKRKPSFNKGEHTSTVLTTLEMVPKPKLTERFISHKGHVLKFPSGKIGDVLNELSPRSVVLRERIFQTYLDPQQTLPKEAIHLRHILSVQSILQHKFAGEGRLDLHCFEVVLGVPKGASTSVTGGGGGTGLSALAAASMSTNPDLLITSGTSANVKLARQSYMFGTHKRSDRNLWMAKVLQSVTDVFGGEGDLLREFLRAGWCYVKKSVTAPWSGAWLLLAKRKLYLYSFADHRLEELDLRKARCIGVVDNEPEAIGTLYVEHGPSLFIDCPPYTTLYFVMGSPRETQIWHKVIRQVAHKNGLTLHSQQLTRGDVPVLIDKCINFIYAHGSMSEGIYRKSGSQSAVVRIQQLFNEDAFNVQLTRNEYNEYDVAGALKKFIRELPGSFFGSYAASFVAIGTLNGVGDGQQLKIDSYRQLLDRLPRIEYCTLKKLLGHLAFIASLESHNRMGVPNLAMIWGSVLLANASQNTVQERTGYHQQDADVVADLIRLYSNLFPVAADELYKEQLMLTVLKKYHAAAENLSDTVKHSGDLKVWITIDCDNPPEEESSIRVGGRNSTGREDKAQVNVDVNPTKTAADICKELAAKTKHPWYKLTLYEVIANDALIRPIHYSEKVLEIVVRWTYWDESDRKNNYLTLKPTTTLNDVYRTIQKAPVLTPTMELKFAERKTKTLRSLQLQLIGRGLVVLKKMEKKDKGFEEMLKIDLTQMTAYIGCEPKRDCSSLRWAITLVDHSFKKRTRDSPFIGHVFGGFDYASQILWYSSILYSQYKDDILPSGDLFF